MTLCLLITGTAVISLLFLVLLQRHEIRSVSRQLREIAEQDTNLLVHSNGSGRASAELIDEINVLLREVRHSKVSYQQKSHALEQMMTNVSHDLRTPLTSAMGYVHLIRHSDLSADEQDRELAIIEKRLLRLAELIDSFFEFSQVISCGRAPERSEVNVIAILEEAISHHYDDYCGQDREILFRYGCSRQFLRSNAKMLLRIFDNLIVNALKHGEGSLTISVEAEEDVRIRFTNRLRDPSMNLARIFDEFYTTDISRTKGNTGLGLAIVKQFTELLGGSVSAQHKGGLFLLTLMFPAAPTPKEDRPIKRSSP